MRFEQPCKKAGRRSRTANCFAAAEAAGFDLLLTTDKNIRYQQDLSERKIAIVVLGQQQWPRLRSHVRLVVEAVNLARPGSYTEVEVPAEPRPPRPEPGS